jgi:broad specificity phosphatase PhoE
MNKLIYCIRHGEAIHNINFHKYGVSAFYGKENIDTELTYNGHEDSIVFGTNWKDKHSIELVLVSPLTRALDTCMNIFGDTDIPIVCLEDVREYPCGTHTCNQRKSIQELKRKYPKVRFNLFTSNEDILWNGSRNETVDELKERIRSFQSYVMKRPETTIALVGHSGFISQMLFNRFFYLENGDHELKHCYPYTIKL